MLGLGAWPLVPGRHGEDLRSLEVTQSDVRRSLGARTIEFGSWFVRMGGRVWKIGGGWCRRRVVREGSELGEL